MKKTFYSLIIIFSVVLCGCEKKEDVIIIDKSRTLQIKADMSGKSDFSADAATRVSLNPDGDGVKVRWEVGDVIYFVFAEDGEAKSKSSITLKADNISDGGASANFEIEAPETVSDKFDFYGVHGGGGFDNYKLKLPTIAQSTATDLNGFGQNVTMHHSVAKGVNINTNDRVNFSFDHIGSLFHIKLNSFEGATLSGITKAVLWSHDDIFAVQNENNNITYDPITGELSGTNYNNELQFSIKKADLTSNGTVEFWGWYIPGSTESWPALGLKLITAEGEIISGNEKPVSTSSYVKGKAYQFYALYNGMHLLLTDDASNDIAYSILIDSRDDTIYKTVEIGNQVWMAENLKYLPEGSLTYTSSYRDPIYSVYDYNGIDVEEAKATDNYRTYGVLYNWAAAMAGSVSSNNNPSGVQGICPDGWHLPSEAEWDEMRDYLIANGYNYDGTTTGNKIGIAMSEPRLWSSDNGAGTIGNSENYPGYANKSGFSARPGGHRYFDRNFYDITRGSNWWSSTQSSAYNATSIYLGYHYNDFHSYYNDKQYEFSVRCVRD